MSGVVLAVLLTYLAVLLALGFWGNRESHTVAGYYVAGKRLPSWVIAFSNNATGESGWLLLGLTGMGYAVGAHAFWVILGEVLGVAAAWTFVARPFKEYTDRYDAITVPDYLEERFRDTGQVLRWVGIVVLLSMVLAYIAAQLTASGKAFDSFLGTGYTGGVLLGAVVILFYTAVGGFKAVAYSDFVQGVLMFGALVVLPFVTFAAAGGWEAVMGALAAEDPALLRPMGSYGLTAAGVASAAGFVAIGLAFLGSPQLLARFISARDQKQLVDGGLVAVVCIVGFDVGAVFTGMAGRVLFPGLADPETVLPVASVALLPPILSAVVLVVVLAAIMSTVDSLLILASSAVVRDGIQKIGRSDAPERRLSAWGKAATVVLGLGALVLALGEVRMVFWFVLFAWSGIACAFTPVVLCSLFWKRTTRAGAVAGMVGGFLVTVGWVVFFKPRFLELYEMIPGFAAGLVLTVAVSLVTRPPEGAGDELESVGRAVGGPFRAPARNAPSSEAAVAAVMDGGGGPVSGA